MPYLLFQTYIWDKTNFVLMREKSKKKHVLKCSEIIKMGAKFYVDVI